MNNTFTGHNTFIFLFPTRPRAFFLALICSGCNGLGWTDPRVYQEEEKEEEGETRRRRGEEAEEETRRRRNAPATTHHATPPHRARAHLLLWVHVVLSGI